MSYISRPFDAGWPQAEFCAIFLGERIYLFISFYLVSMSTVELDFLMKYCPCKHGHRDTTVMRNLKCNFSFPISSSLLWVVSLCLPRFKQLRLLSTERYLLPEGFEQVDYESKKNKLQNSPPCHTPHTGLSLAPYVPLLRIHYTQRKGRRARAHITAARVC